MNFRITGRSDARISTLSPQEQDFLRRRGRQAFIQWAAATDGEEYEVTVDDFATCPMVRRFDDELAAAGYTAKQRRLGNSAKMKRIR